MILEDRLHRLRLAAMTPLLLVAATGCGAAQHDAARAASPAAPVGASTGAGAPATATPASPPADASAAAPSAVAPDADSEDRSGAAREFERAARMVDGASSDCRQACRALASMDRACGQLCRLDADSTCEGDKTRLRSARQRVRSTCGSCSDGTSVEPDGPIPQPR